MSDELNMSSVTADPAPETAGKRAAPEEKPPKTPGKRAGLIIGIIAAVLVLAYAGCCVAANALYSHTAFPNTSVLGMDMSGLSAQEAEQRWTEQGSALLDGMTIRLTRDGQEIGSTTLSDLGVTVLPVYVSKAAGCDVQDRGWGSDVTAFLRGGWRFIESWFRAVDVTPQLDVDEAKLTAACEQLSDTVGCTVTDGGYRLAEGEGLYITKPQDGEKLDAAALRALLTAEGFGPIVAHAPYTINPCSKDERTRGASRAATCPRQPGPWNVCSRPTPPRPWTCRRSTTRSPAPWPPPSATNPPASPPSPAWAYSSMWRRCKSNWTPPSRARNSWLTPRCSSRPPLPRSWSRPCSGT